MLVLIRPTALFPDITGGLPWMQMLRSTCGNATPAIKARQDKPSGTLHPLELPVVPWECVSLDFTTQLPVSSRGNDAIMVVSG